MAFGLAETARLAVDLSLKGNFSSALAANQRALKGFDAAIDRTSTRAFRAGQQIGTGIKNVARIIAVGAVTAVGGLVAAIKVAGDFEAQLNTINTVALATPAALAKAGAGIRSLARDYGSTFAPISDLTAAEYDLVSAGIQLKDSQAGLTAAVRLGIGSYGTAAEGVDVLTTAINSYNLKAKDGTVQTGAFAKLSDELAQAVADGKVKLSEIAAEYATVAPLAAAAGIGTDEIAAALGRVTATGSSAGDTLTQMSRAIVELQKPTAELTKLQDKFHKNYAEIAKDKGLNVALEQMRIDAKKAGVPFIDLFGRIEAFKFALNSTGPNAAAFRAELDRVRHSAGALDKQVNERTKGLNFQLARTKALFQDALITLANPSLPRVASIFERLNKALGDPNVQANLAAIGERIAGLFSDDNINKGIGLLQGFVREAKEFAPVLAASARTTFEITKAAVGLFTSLPKEVQQLAIGAFAINKITGGLVTNVAGGLISSVLKQLVSGVVNVNGAVVNVNGAGIPGAPGAPVPGGGVDLKGLVTRAAITGAAIGVANNAFNHLTPEGEALLGKPGTVTIGPADAAAKTFIGPQQGFLKNLSGQLNNAFTAALKAGGISPSGALNKIPPILDALHQSFKTDFAALIHATKANDIATAAKKVAAEIAKGVGSTDTTKNVLATLRKQLSNTHDPALQHTLRDAIAKVERRLPGREFAARSIAKADAALRDGKLTNRELSDLKTIERQLKDRGLPHAAAVIQAKIDGAKRAQVEAARLTTQAIKNKDLDVKVVIPINTRATTIINGRTFTGTVNRQTILVRPGQAAVPS